MLALLVQRRMNPSGLSHITPSVRAALEKARRRLGALYGEQLVRVVLYGSQARGDAHPDSDVDVLVVLHEPFDLYAEVKRLNRLHYELLVHHSVDVNFQPYTEEAYADLSRPFIQNVHTEGIEL